MNKPLWVIANFKSNKTLEESLKWVDELAPKIERRPNIKVVVCPQFIALEEVKKAILVGNYPMLVGAQDLSPFEEGPYTGEEAAKSLKGIVDLVILGHSERRKNFGETDEMISEKVKQAKEQGIIPLVCVQDQNTPVPEGVELLAYEPIFAIGTGNPDTPQNAQAVSRDFKRKYSQDLEVLYGGSVKPENVKAFVSQEEISGVLVGGASLDPEEFLEIIEQTYYI